MNNDKNQNNRGEKNDKYAQQLNSREIDHAYYAHPETCRNQWFNYSDPYTSDDQQVENYQKQTAQNEKINSNNVFNPSQNHRPRIIPLTASYGVGPVVLGGSR